MLDKIRDKMGYDSLRMVWAQRIINIGELRYLFDGSDELEHIKQHLTRAAALNIIELIRDGKLYAIQAKWFSDLPDKETVIPWLTDYELIDHDFHIGYHGSISEVETSPHIVYYQESSSAYWPIYRLVTWQEIKKGIVDRLKNDITVSNIFLWLYKEAVGRILYLPEINPEHWGFKGGPK